MNAKSRTLAALVAVLSLFGLTGCLWGAGNERPISMTIRDGEYVFHWCGEPTEAFRYMEISYATHTPEREDAMALRASGEFRFHASDEFTPSEPPAGLEIEYESAIPVENTTTLVFIYTGDSEDVLNGVSATFRPQDVTKLEGRWLYPSGAVRDTPCEMRGAH